LNDVDPYLNRETGILRNLLGIAGAQEFERVEADITAARAVALQYRRLDGDYRALHLKAFHRYLFGGIYAWAGEFRTVDIARSPRFGSWRHVEAYLDDQLAELRSENYLAGLDRVTFTIRFGHYFGEVNAAHPFRDGNGRAQRALFSQLARDAGWGIRWSEVSRAENAQACEASLGGDPGKLQALFLRVVQPRR
jgi:cell filamentation protein